MKTMPGKNGSMRQSLQPFGARVPERILILRALPGLGDMLCLVPALRALRAALPEAHISLLGLPQAQSFVDRFGSYIDKLIDFPGFPGLPECPPVVQQLPAFFTYMHQQQFDLALQMHGSGITTNSLLVLLGATTTGGFFLPGQYCPDEKYFLPYPGREPEIWRHLRLMEFFGIPLQGEALEFPLTEADYLAREAIKEARDLRPGRYVCLHPGASIPLRQWPPDRFAAVADALAEMGFQIVLTGTAPEQEITETVSRMMHHPAIDLAGKTSLGALAVLLKDTRLLVCNDTGVSHLGAAVQVPSVVIFLASNLNRWAPLNRLRHRPVGGLKLGTNGHSHKSCFGAERCLRDDCRALVSAMNAPHRLSITVDTVLTQAKELLRQEATYGTR